MFSAAVRVSFVGYLRAGVCERRLSFMTNPNTLQARYEAAAAAIKTAEAMNRSARTMSKLYKALFTVEDEAKAAGAL